MKKITFLIITLFTVTSFAQVGFQQNIVIDESFGAYSPNDVISADIDNDGFNDIISSSESKIVWYKNLDGLGNFSNTNLITSGSFQYSNVKAVDLDNDNDLDIVFFQSNSNDRDLVWVENLDGLGNFGPITVLLTLNSSNALNLQIVDFEGDNDLDIVYSSATYMAWFENTDGLANFTNHTLFGNNNSNSTVLNSFYVTDVDNDNRIDLIVDFGNDLKCYKQDNTGGFTLLDFMNTFALYRSLIGADIDNDGDTDILAFFKNGQVKRIHWFENTDGLGNFANAQTLIDLPNQTSSTNSDIIAIKTTDIDNDGKQDILLIESKFNSVSWFKNLGNLSFFENQYITQNVKDVRSAFAIDVNGNGFKDIITSSRGDHKIVWFGNLDGQNFNEEQLISTIAYFPNHVDKGDLDGDGDLDLISSSHFDGKLAWYENTNGIGDFSNTQHLISNEIESSRNAFIVDFDNDFDNDIVVQSFIDDTDTSKIIWFENDGFANFTEHLITENNESINIIKYADIDNDTDFDIISVSSNNILSVYKNNGNGTFAAQQIIPTTDTNYALSLELNDIDGDNNIDILLAYNNNQIIWYDNLDGLGNFTNNHIIIEQMHYPISVIAVDINGDNYKDVVFANKFQSQIGYFLNTDGNGNFGPINLIPNNLYRPSIIYAYDVDLDGDQDLIANSETGSKLVWYQNNGLAVFSDAIEITTNTEVINTITTGDIDANGTLDILTSSYNDDMIAWYSNLGAFTNTIKGNVNLDLNIDNCNTGISMSQVLVSTENSTNTFSTFTNLDGSYRFSANVDSFTTTVTSPLENYTSSPNSYNSDFIDLNNTEILNFCVEPNSVFNDLDIVIQPISPVIPGFLAKYNVIINNKGTTTLTGSFNFTFNDAKFNFFSASVAPYNQIENQLFFNFENLLPFQTNTINLQLDVLTIPNVTIGENLNFSATIDNTFVDETISDNTFELTQTVVGSFDPNDIVVLEGEEILLEDATNYLHYIIRFQNVGNYFAQRVRVNNVLDTKLDWATLQLESYSHNVETQITDGNTINFIFDAIYLPDSTSDEPNSHGYIAYKIKPKSNVSLGDIFYNNADIYFDFNPKIETNIATTEIVKTLGVNSLNTLNFSIYPIPTKDILTIKLNSVIAKIELYNSLGKLILSEISNNELDISVLENGIYFVKVIDINGNFNVKKVLKK